MVHSVLLEKAQGILLQLKSLLFYGLVNDSTHNLGLLVLESVINKFIYFYRKLNSLSFIYSIFIHSLGAFMQLAARFNQKSKLWVNGRVNWRQQLKRALPTDRKILWFHCASLGEFDQGLPLMQSMKEKDPSYFLFVTFFSPSGMEHYQKRGALVDAACYLPLDTRSNARDFVKIVRPDLAIFVKYEFWPNLLHVLGEKKIKTVAVSAIFRKNQVYFKWYGHFFRKALKNIGHFYVQNDNSAALLQRMGLDNHTVTGDLRYERVAQAKEQTTKNSNPVLAAFTNEKNVLILGSSWPKEEEILRASLTSLEGFKVIIAPHDLTEKHLDSICLMFPNALRYTHLSNEASWEQLGSAHVLILDCIGLLSSAYQYGSLAFVGGGYTGSLHNILEPAVYGLPILFGPIHHKFPEADLFLQKGFALEVENGNEFVEKVNTLLQNQEKRSQEIMNFVQAQRGMSAFISASILGN